ncbi:hypothetical protein A946_01965 [Methylacidiphilum kamchatkense Kam1]|uniref:Uncharacterized protein n=1 Tax=Methylacidiphilum kamchatkense Kam1 TaxID=1202785 RepID=A0A0C1UT43_9BACT|nr:hypothetical protein [Methylacidiphilum kamchatkense]KIE59464.1 hypothetical protein A946_01965 [Methylacidiphilum kamchatkense Kam1]QDQ42540.1 hypothetical protein kam1_1315 [Methylacidiphilum kamchatkense Kam1]
MSLLVPIAFTSLLVMAFEDPWAEENSSTRMLEFYNKAQVPFLLLDQRALGVPNILSVAESLGDGSSLSDYGTLHYERTPGEGRGIPP